MKSDAKENQNKEIRIDRLQAELDDIIDKSTVLEKNFEEEISNVQNMQED